ncbi:hypothetical protein JD844_010713 [Phrynosoma platyrhinos]|uniref:Signal transducer and activator of transcription n=1 Tax=Phrynosoma platyrhinos TaxID=52577 RepID=A0ABQ7THV2_PHRPL|nr:hypothetical protein JD844_010713 [Phrynosoma platyrhinos]
MPPAQFSDLFEEFPHDLRCFLGDWLEAQPWEFINNTSDSFCAVLAARLLSAMVEMLHDLANKNGPPGPILQLTANLENRYRREPLKLVEAVKRILRGERAAIQEKFQHVPLFVHRQREELMFEFSLQRLQYRVQEIQALQESLEMNSNSTRVSLQLKMLDPQFPVQEKLHTNSLQNLQTLFLNTISELEEAKKSVLARLMIWKRQQQLAGNGTPFDEDLSPLQRSSFLVDKQPPQVLKTQTKFQATVRFLLGPQLLKHPHTSFMVTADIVTEKQARELATSPSGSIFRSLWKKPREEKKGKSMIKEREEVLSTGKEAGRGVEHRVDMIDSYQYQTMSQLMANFEAQISESSGEIVNNTAPLETNATSNACCALFKSMNRIPFVVAERVSWNDMCETLNQKFMAEVQTTKGLLKEHYFFLAQKIFGDNDASPEEFQKRPVSWSQFNKDHINKPQIPVALHNVFSQSKKERLIIGFISKQYVFSCLSTAPVGTFLLRFSDSEIGGISIAYVTCFQDGSTQVENIQPFTAKQLSMRSLADCVLDLSQLQILYPDRPKHEAFRRHCNAEAPRKSNYVPAKLKITVDPPSAFPAQTIQTQVDSMSNPNLNPGMYSDPPYDEVTYSYSLGNASRLGQMGSYPMPSDVDMPDICMQNENTPVYATDLHMLPNQIMMPEMISPPSDEELALLLHSEQDLNCYSQDPA